jgi:hypothetical protein
MDLQGLVLFCQAHTQQLSAYFDQLTEAQAQLRADESAWTVLECLEHSLIVEEGTFQLMVKKNSATPEDRTIAPLIGVEKIRAICHRRQDRYQAHPTIAPQGRYATLAALRPDYLRFRSQLTEYLALQQPALDTYIGQHPVFGGLTTHDCVCFMMLHTERHLLQIDEILQATSAIPSLYAR